MAAWHFEQPDHETFPALQLGYEVARRGGTCGAVLNAANEVAVAAFLDRRIRFDQIHAVNLATLSAVLPSNPASLEALLALDALARESAACCARGLAA